MKHNKTLLSILLLSSIAASIFATTLSIGKDRYMEARADSPTSYKTVCLYVPNNVANYNDHETTIQWDTVEDNVEIYTTGDKSYHQMFKIAEHLFAFNMSDAQKAFYFRTKIGGTYYKSQGDPTHDSTPISYSALIDNNYLVTLGYYAYNSTSPKNEIGSWSSLTSLVNQIYITGGESVEAARSAAEYYANAFFEVLGNEHACTISGNSTVLMVKDVWNGLETLYSTINSNVKSVLTSINDSSSDTLKTFVELYDYVYWKYGNVAGFGDDFLSRGIEPRSINNIPSVIIDNDNINKNIIVIVSISAISISVVGLYFFIRKRKEK